MKKIITSMVLFSAIVSYGSVKEPMPTPNVSMQTLYSVQSISSYLLQYLIHLLQRMILLPESYRMQVGSAFILEVYKNNTPHEHDACTAVAINVIKAKGFNDTWQIANRHLREPAPTKIANSFSSNLHIELNKYGIHGNVIKPYIGNELYDRVINAVSNSEYDGYRR